MQKAKYIAIAYLLLPSLALATNKKIVGEVDTGDEVIIVFGNIANWIYTFFLIASVITFLLAAFKFLTAAGDTDKLSEAKRMIIYTVIAIAIALLASSVPTVIENSLIKGQ